MIKIYSENEIKKDVISYLLNDNDVWDYPLEEIDYLNNSYSGCSYVLIKDRLYELSSANTLVEPLYASINAYAEEISKGKTNVERKNIFFRLYVSNAKLNEIKSGTLRGLLEYIFDTDDFWNEDKEAIIECAKLCGATDKLLEEIKDWSKEK
jgi:hypothetical protein